jgi:peptidoglycan/xylan/chitin deacetylase (PgdA/CDA1 family)
MIAIMYHYVRPDDPNLPHWRHLHVDDFVRQLDWIGSELGFVDIKDFEESLSSGAPSKGAILTFDDGFKDHYHYVLPELLKRGLWGIFYIPTSPYSTKKLIDVHRIHMLIGKYGGEEIAKTIRAVVTKSMLTDIHVKEFHAETYSGQINSSSVEYVKRALNYFIDYKYRQDVIDKLMSLYFPLENDLVDNFYMTKQELAHMHNSGMILGSHTVSHPVMSKLTVTEQEQEIISSFEIIESITGKQTLKTFCYPYGGFHTFNAQTEELLEKHSCLFSFNVEPRSIEQRDLIARRQALSRFDCNAFPNGAYRHSSKL